MELRKWFRVIHLMLTSKKGVSARQVHRDMGFGPYKTAWHMCHRIRLALLLGARSTTDIPTSAVGLAIDKKIF